MLSFNLAITGCVALGLFIVTSLIQATRRKGKVGCWSNFLLLIGLGAMLFSIILNIGAENTNPLTQPVILGAIIATVVTGLVLYAMERGREDFQPMFSRGILGGGIGLLLLVAYFLVPALPEFVFPVPTPTPISVASISEQEIVSNIVPTESVDATPTQRVTAQPTTTRTPLPSPSPTRTRRAYVPPTATPTPEAQPVSEDCDARVTVNLNMRSEPNTDSEIVIIIPEGRFISILGRNPDREDQNWWRGEFDGETGWVSGDFLELDPICLVE